MTWRIAWHTGFGGTHSIETTHPERVVRAVRRQHADWIDIHGVTSAAPHSVGSQSRSANQSHH
jgi:hypothetical protein